MMAFLILLFQVVVSLFKTQARLEAEIIMLRHQLNVLRRRGPSKPKLTVPGVLPAARDGKLRLLAIIAPERAPAAPDVPTLAEAGVRAVDVPTWQAVFAPASTPKAIVDHLNA